MKHAFSTILIVETICRKTLIIFCSLPKDVDNCNNKSKIDSIHESVWM